MTRLEASSGQPFSDRKVRLKDHFRIKANDRDWIENAKTPISPELTQSIFYAPSSLKLIASHRHSSLIRIRSGDPASIKITKINDFTKKQEVSESLKLNRFLPSLFSIIQTEPFMRPFTHSKIAVFNAMQKKHIYPALCELERLRCFLGSIFLFENPLNSKLADLKANERSILLKIMGKKQYSNQSRLMAALNSQIPPNIHDFLMMEQTKRKEDYIKYSFRALIKYFKLQFEKEKLSKLCETGFIKRKDRETLFYLFYFCDVEFDETFESLASRFFQKKISAREIEKKLGQYYFPDLTNLRKHNEEHHQRAKSFSKKFFNTIAKSDRMVGKINDTLLKMLGAMSQLGGGFDPIFLRDRQLCKDETVKNMLFIMVDNSNREIGKIFTEWDNLVKQRNRGISKVDHQKVLDIALENVDKTNFKFPWSIGEARTAFLETFLVVNERFQFSISSGIYSLFVKYMGAG